ncbi:DNA/RNA non-specific endonuclease [Herpetosiphon sp.]|uniref:Endonuclease n=1 Tax=Herpetosiphon aurantiacus (strain ATCC 23779 / DSM 785 / 114-95) TaxID=316274 RepID=A9B0R6_HERA2|nr:DNA/RNA non-specific endonuclease [Herpetosiphon sp.]ABX03786.1 DNA/RNA non-specific endonuclease [Herpetosiphon aurantiacus DSM 785]
MTGLRRLLGLLVLGLLALGLRQPTTQAAPNDSLHLTLGNPSNAVADPLVPNNYLIERTQYALAYQRDAGIPAWVSWHLEVQDLGSTSRGDFAVDTSLPSGWYRVATSDYSGSGYDRGHMTPSGDRTSSRAANDQTFIMSNIIPQAPDNNQGPWNDLENDSRTWARAGNELYIISGGYGTKGTIASGRVLIPAVTWKVIVVLPVGNDDANRVAANTRVIGIWMPNDQGIRSNAWEQYRVSVDYIESMTGYDFLSNVPTAIQAIVEAQVDGSPVVTVTPGTVSPTATRTPTATPTATRTATPTATTSATATPSNTLTPTATVTTIPSVTPSITASATPSVSATVVIPQYYSFLPYVTQ